MIKSLIIIIPVVISLIIPFYLIETDYKFRSEVRELLIEIGLKEIDNKDYEKKFDDLFEYISSKHKNLGKLNRKKKVFDYLQYRGWENDKIFKKINELWKKYY